MHGKINKNIIMPKKVVSCPLIKRHKIVSIAENMNKYFLFSSLFKTNPKTHNGRMRNSEIPNELLNMYNLKNLHNLQNLNNK